VDSGNASWLGSTPASDSWLAFTMMMNRIVIPPREVRSSDN
jgi:hypothetical protein